MLVVVVDGNEHHFFLEKVDVLTSSEMSVVGYCSVVETRHLRGRSGWGKVFHKTCTKDMKFIRDWVKFLF